MTTFVNFTIVGVSTAAIYAVIASGLVLTYTTTGVFNFANGALGMLAAFAYWQVHVGWGWPTVPSVAFILVVIAPLAGLLLEALLRLLRDTSETTMLAVSVSLLFGMIGLAQAVWNPTKARTVDKFFGNQTIHIGSASLGDHQLVTIVVAIVVALVLRFLLYETRIGISMRATVDDRSLTALSGARTVRVRQLSWVVSTILAATGGILVASTAGLNAQVIALLIVDAYAAAIFGRLRSLPLTFVGALVVGLTDGYLQGYLPQSNYLAGLRLAAPVIILFGVLLVLPNPRLRGRVRTREFFPAPARRGLLIFCALTFVFGLVLATTLSSSDLSIYDQIFPAGVIALSIVPLLGFSNQPSLCQFSLAGIGAIAYAHYGAGGNPLGLLAAILITAVVGALVALPALRLSGIYLALATAAFAVALDRWVFTLPDFHIGSMRISLFGQGALIIDPLKVGSVHFTSAKSQLLLSAGVLAVLSAVVGGLRRSRFGRRLVAQRDSEAACATFGMGLVGTRLAVFSLSAAIAGLGGALFAMQAQSIQASDFQFSAGLLSLGREPSGAAALWRDGFRYLIADRVIQWSTIGGLVVVWLLRLAHVFGNWPYVIVSLAVFLAGTATAEVRARRRGLSPSWLRPGAAPRPASEELDIDMLTTEHAWSAATLRAIDNVLGPSEFRQEIRAEEGAR
jgi:branched-chain amino acid transport system permease protein